MLSNRRVFRLHSEVHTSVHTDSDAKSFAGKWIRLQLQHSIHFDFLVVRSIGDQLKNHKIHNAK